MTSYPKLGYCEKLLLSSTRVPRWTCSLCLLLSCLQEPCYPLADGDGGLVAGVGLPKMETLDGYVCAIVACVTLK